MCHVTSSSSLVKHHFPPLGDLQTALSAAFLSIIVIRQILSSLSEFQTMLIYFSFGRKNQIRLQKLPMNLYSYYPLHISDLLQTSIQVHVRNLLCTCDNREIGPRKAHAKTCRTVESIRS